MISAIRTKLYKSSKSIWLLTLVLPTLILLPGIGEFPYPSELAEYSDVTVSHYPILTYIKYALEKWHTLPMWSPDILSGYPLIADPLSGLLYPPGWLALFFPLPHAFNLSIIFHLVIGGAGAYLFCRAEGIGHRAALFAGLAFEAMPKFFAHFGAGHLTLIYAVSLTPWLLFVAALQKQRIASPRYPRFSAWEGVILGFIFLADPRWAVYAGLLWLGYGLFVRSKGNLNPSIFSQLKHLVYQSVLALCVAAPLALPLLEYTRLSTRTSLEPGEVLTLSLPPARLLGMIYPDLGGFHEWVFYPGAIVVVLTIIGALWSGWRGKRGYWLGVAGVSLILALGAHSPVGRYLVQIPVFDVLRVPPRALFLFGIALVIMAANGLEVCLEDRHVANLGKVRLALVSIIGFIFMLSIGTFVIAGKLPINISWGSGAYLAVSFYLIWVLLLRKKRVMAGNAGQALLLTGFVFLLLADLIPVNTTLFDMRSTKSVFSLSNTAIAYIREQPGDFRVYSPSYSLDQTTAARERILLSDGVHPLQLDSYANYMEEASGVERQGYSVTIPPFITGNPKADNIDAVPDPKLLGLLNVRYLLSEYELSAEGVNLILQTGTTHLYENPYAKGLAWVTPDRQKEPPPGNRVSDLYWSPNQIVVEASGPGWLVTSEINYPGWVVSVDGERREIKAAFDILRSVYIEEGNHQVVFTFRPTSFYLGLGMAGAGFAIVALGEVFRKMARRS